MRSVNISTPKNTLSSCLREVRRGEEILVCDRKVPIAKIVPLSSTDDSDAELMELVAAGLVRLAERPFRRILSLDQAVAAVSAERDEEY